jgi:hypothetical protein
MHHIYVSVATHLRRSIILALLAGINLLIVVLTTGCTSRNVMAQENPVPHTTDVATGATMFTPEQLAAVRRIAINYGCASCHTIGIFPEARGIFGPDLTHIGSDADNVILTQGYKDSGGKATIGKDYIRESILKPTVYVATDCPKGTCPTGLMPPNFRQQFAPYPDDLNLLIEVLYSLK